MNMNGILFEDEQQTIIHGLTWNSSRWEVIRFEGDTTSLGLNIFSNGKCSVSTMCNFGERVD